MCVLLSHPQQRCAQDEFDAPKDLAKMVAPVPRTSSSGGLPQLRKEGEDDGSGPRTFWVICLKSLNSNLCSLHRCVVQHLSIGLFAIPGIHILLFIYCWSRQTRWRLSLIALHMNCALHPKLRTYIVSVRHLFVLFCSLMLQCGAQLIGHRCLLALLQRWWVVEAVYSFQTCSCKVSWHQWLAK
jgi:hypothetical protein